MAQLVKPTPMSLASHIGVLNEVSEVPLTIQFPADVLEKGAAGGPAVWAPATMGAALTEFQNPFLCHSACQINRLDRKKKKKMITFLPYFYVFERQRDRPSTASLPKCR